MTAPERGNESLERTLLLGWERRDRIWQDEEVRSLLGRYAIAFGEGFRFGVCDRSLIPFL